MSSKYQSGVAAPAAEMGNTPDAFPMRGQSVFLADLRRRDQEDRQNPNPSFDHQE